MTFKEGLFAARSRIVFLLGLTSAIVIIGVTEKTLLNSNSGAKTEQPKQVAPGASSIQPGQQFVVEKTATIQLPAPSDLSAQELEWAQIAWKYFENNYQPTTGLTNSVDNYPASTMWDTGSYLMAVISAHQLGIIPIKTLKERLEKALTALRTMPLFEDKLPNKSYNTLTKEMVDYNNNKTPRGIGWSVIDVGRLFVPFHRIIWHYPEFATAIREILWRFRFEDAVHNGILYGAAVDSTGKTIFTQEGRIGYEEYAAKSYALMGSDVGKALQYEDYLHYESIYSIQIPTDSRNPDYYKAFNYVVSEPYILDGLEYGFDEISKEFAYRVYAAQEARFNNTGIVTAVSEDNIDTAPYFVYNTVFTAGKAWNCITDKGEDASAYKSLSAKAVFGWYALYQTPYTKRLLDAIKTLYDPERGWYSGLYESSGKPNTAITANTNAIILEALCYKKFGSHIKLLR